MRDRVVCVGGMGQDDIKRKKKQGKYQSTRISDYHNTLLVHLLNLRRRSVVMRNDAIVIGDNERYIDVRKYVIQLPDPYMPYYYT